MRDQRIAKLDRADRMARVSKITTLYHCHEQKSISKHLKTLRQKKKLKLIISSLTTKHFPYKKLHLNNNRLFCLHGASAKQGHIQYKLSL